MIHGLVISSSSVDADTHIDIARGVSHVHLLRTTKMLSPSTLQSEVSGNST